jgi:3-oxoacyl-[acyl-carrier-protein] synthase II
VPDPHCGVHLVLQTQQAADRLDAAISSSFAFGGTNAVLVFKRA